ncbi:hypothetical protein CTA1_6466 [Colletotrichum tanaceti]|uniref:NAD-specific glutamate dehydrogenase n=1 Tax=Colletotrichum tanaceti TaxID=1306861 RepID=A0A4U6XRM6_9PEZI|nr:hypothetical protein CTA1_6466 [Colletotrichum tanaceti]
MSLHLEHVTAVFLELLNLVASIDLLAAHLGLGVDGLHQHVGDVGNGPRGTAQVEAALVADVRLDDIAHGLAHAVLDVDLAGLIAGEGGAEVGDDAGVDVGLPLLAVKVLLALVAGAEVQQDGTDLLAAGLLQGAVLDEGAEGRQARAEAGHDEGRLGGRRELHDGGLDGGDDGRADGQAREVTRGVAEAVAAAGVNPVNDNDHEGDGVGGHGLGGCDGVLAALERGDDADQVVERRAGRGELLENVDVGDEVDLGALLEVGGALGTAEAGQDGPLALVRGELGQRLVEALGRLAEHVDVLLEGLVDGASLQGGRVFTGGDLDDGLRVEAVPGDELLDLGLVVLSMDAEGLANVVSEARVAEVELDVEDVAVVRLRREATVLLDGDGLLEGEALGGRLPVDKLRRLLRLLLVKADEAVGLDGRGQGAGNDVLGELSPGGLELDSAQGLAESLLDLSEGQGKTFGKGDLSDLLGSDVRAGNLKEGKLQQNLNGLGLLLGDRGLGGVQNVELNGLVEDLLAHDGREALLEILLFEAREVQEQLATGLDALEDVEVLEKLLVANGDDVSLLDGVGGLDGLLGAADVGADDAALEQVVEGLVDIDVAGGLTREQVADNGRRVDGNGVVGVPEGVLMGLDQRGEGLSLGIGIDKLAKDVGEGLRCEGLRGGVLDVRDRRVLAPLSGERDGSQDVGVESGLQRGVIDGELVLDLAQDRDGPGGLGNAGKEFLLDEGAVDADVDGADFDAIGGQTVDDLLGELGLGAAKDDEDGLGIVMSVVLEQAVGGAELVVEELEQLNDFAGIVESLVQGLDLARDLLVGLGDALLVQGVGSLQRLLGQLHPVLDTQVRGEGSHQSSQESRVLALVVIGGVEVLVEDIQEVGDLGGDGGSLADAGGLGGDAVVQVGNAALAERVNDTGGLAGEPDTVVDVEGRHQSGHEGREQGHVLRLVGAGAGNETETQLLGGPQSRIVVGNQTIGGVVVEGGDVSDEGGGDSVKKAQLVQGAAKVLQTQGGSEQSLWQMPLGQVEVGAEDVTQGEGAGAGPSLQLDKVGGLAVNVLLLSLGPRLCGDVEVEGGSRVGEDFVGQQEGNLLDEQLGRHVGRAGDGGECHGLAERKGRRHLLLRNGRAVGLLLLGLHLGRLTRQKTGNKRSKDEATEDGPGYTEDQKIEPHHS